MNLTPHQRALLDELNQLGELRGIETFLMSPAEQRAARQLYAKGLVSRCTPEADGRSRRYHINVLGRVAIEAAR
jgi:DNA-binding MarR family transcriptional regulator